QGKGSGRFANAPPLLATAGRPCETLLRSGKMPPGCQRLHKAVAPGLHILHGCRHALNCAERKCAFRPLAGLVRASGVPNRATPMGARTEHWAGSATSPGFGSSAEQGSLVDGQD